jgi:hypothetical protein
MLYSVSWIESKIKKGLQADASHLSLKAIKRPLPEKVCEKRAGAISLLSLWKTLHIDFPPTNLDEYQISNGSTMLYRQGEL